MSFTCILRRQTNSLRTPKPLRLVGSVRHKSSTANYLPPLLPPNRWRDTFKTYPLVVRDRISVSNINTGRFLAEAFLSKKSIAAGKGKTVIEAFPGGRYCYVCYPKMPC